MPKSVQKPIPPKNSYARECKILIWNNLMKYTDLQFYPEGRGIDFSDHFWRGSHPKYHGYNIRFTKIPENACKILLFACKIFIKITKIPRNHQNRKTPSRYRKDHPECFRMIIQTKESYLGLPGIILRATILIRRMLGIS